MNPLQFRSPKIRTNVWILAAVSAVTAAIYWPGLSGGYIFDDYPNIVDNQAVQPSDTSIASLAAAALSSPSSQLKRPLASLSFAGNYLLTGIDPYWMKVTNLIIHVINGLLVYFLATLLISRLAPNHPLKPTALAALIAAGWLTLPINLTAVLYVVQRMESLAHLFVFAGLLGYCHGRLRMLHRQGGSIFAMTSVLAGTAGGLLTKETAILLPLYAAGIEAIAFGFKRHERQIDKRIIGFFVVVLVIPLILGLAWQLSIVIHPSAWSARDFTLNERLLSETRIVLSYIKWTLLPLPGDLSFYHDNFVVSHSLTEPWTTALAISTLAIIATMATRIRKHQPLITLGITLYLAAHTLTATILPLELIYEHRNYFASFGLLLAVIPWLSGMASLSRKFRLTLIALLLSIWAGLTAWTAKAWGHPITLAQELAARAPESPRAQYALARTYLNAANYDTNSPYLEAALSILERARTLAGASALPESALIFVHSKLDRPIADEWWDNMIGKLATRRPDVQDEAAVVALAKCVRDNGCALSIERMVEMFMSASSHPHVGARILGTYSDYAWNILNDKPLAEQLARDAVAAAPNDPTYHSTLIRMLAAQGRIEEARDALRKMQNLNFAGRLDKDISILKAFIRESAKLRHPLPESG